MELEPHTFSLGLAFSNLEWYNGFLRQLHLLFDRTIFLILLYVIKFLLKMLAYLDRLQP